MGTMVLIIVGFFAFIKSKEHSDNVFLFQTLASYGYQFTNDFLRYIATVQNGTVLDRINTKPPQFILTWKDQIAFQLRVKRETQGETSKSMYEITFEFPPKLKNQLDITIRKRGLLSKIFGYDAGDFSHLNKDFNIRGSNFLIINSILTNPQNLSLLRNVMAYTKNLDIRWVNTFIVPKDRHRILFALESILNFTQLLQRLLNTVESDVRYTVKEIRLTRELENFTFQCVICRKNTSYQNMKILNCCASVAHTEHILGWLSQDPRCPYCKRTDVVLLDPHPIAHSY